jgi:pre-mRNA-processing factor 39
MFNLEPCHILLSLVFGASELVHHVQRSQETHGTTCLVWFPPSPSAPYSLPHMRHASANRPRLFERGAACVGLDFLAHPFWDKYIEFEERLEAQDNVFDILGRIINIPMHQYARYFEKYRQLAASRPLSELAPANLLSQFTVELESETKGKSQIEVERAMRARLDTYHLEIFHNTQTETTKRWTYEQEIKRPYFHVTELDEAQLENWSKYLDFEESEADYTRTSFLYERCVVTCAHYDEFWQRYARWMYNQQGKEEEVRNIFQRASCIYTPIARPAVRLHWALFEEACGRPSVAAAIYEAILVTLPGNLEAITRLANLQRRQIGYDAAIQIYDQYVADAECSIDDKGALVVEMARLTWKSKGDAVEARDILSRQEHIFLDSPSFWSGYLSFEIDQQTTLDTAVEQAERVKALHSTIRHKTRLNTDVIRDLSQRYMVYLTEKQSKLAAREYLELDMQVNGPASIATAGNAIGTK